MRHPYDALQRLATPCEGMAQCGTPDAYAASHRRQMQGLQRLYPALAFRDPWPAPDGAVALATGGKWVIVCVCGDAPMAHPDWDEARCFACGAIYRHLQWPPQRHAIEDALLARPQAITRAWLPGESVAVLRRQNREHGVPDRRRR